MPANESSCVSDEYSCTVCSPPHTVFIVGVVFTVISFIFMVISFWVGRCSVKLTSVRRRKKSLMKSYKRPDLSKRISNHFTLTRTKSRDRSEVGDRTSAVGLLRTPEEMRQHNPPRVSRPNTVHELSFRMSDGRKLSAGLLSTSTVDVAINASESELPLLRAGLILS